MNNTAGSSLETEYLKSLDEKEMIAYNIAKGHLGTLFTLEKSNHYLEWLENLNLCTFKDADPTAYAGSAFRMCKGVEQIKKIE